MTNNEAADILKVQKAYVMVVESLLGMPDTSTTKVVEAYDKAIDLLKETPDEEKEEQTNGEEENTQIK